MTVRYRINDTANTRLFIGWAGTTEPTGDDPLNVLFGGLFGKISTNGAWVFMHNDASGNTTVDSSGIAADTNIHKIEITADSAGMYWQLDEGALNAVTTNLPTSTAQLLPYVEIETVDAGIKTFDVFWIDVES